MIQSEALNAQPPGYFREVAVVERLIYSKLEMYPKDMDAPA